jgi:bifunctional NMN adenylyltransferase/nudix hydrolase
MKTAVIIGRFQCPSLHEGHIHLINKAREETGNVVILVGCSVEDNIRSPYPFSTVRNNIYSVFPDVKVMPLMDSMTDKAWSRDVDSILDYLNEPILYGSRDSFIDKYSGKYQYKHVEEIPGVSATAIRNKLKEEEIKQKENDSINN